MNLRRNIWLVLALLLVGGAVWWLSPGDSYHPATPAQVAPQAAIVPVASATVKFDPGSPVFNLLSPDALVARSNALAAARAEKFLHRISNTPKTVGQLARSETAILLENALIDTASAAPLVFPAALQPPADPGSYIVQARGPVDAAFRAQLAAAGATIVSYIPNNAYLVTAATDLRSLTGSRIQAVYAYAPHFKLKSDLVKLVMQGKPLPEDRAVNVLLFPDQRAATGAELEKLGATILAEERSPFGPVLTVVPPANALAAVAALRGVHTVEMLQPRVAANDLSRVRMGVATNSTTAPNYLGLTGAGVVVAVSDSGVDTAHPDLAGRVFVDTADAFFSTNFNFIFDTDGHGTHVAGIIASSGANSAGLTASGSTNPSVAGQYRGKSPAASILSLPQARSDAYLQETAVRSNSFIHNNSWNSGDGYNLTAASYDAATRDALPYTTGSQPGLYVFSAGNGGGGEADGTGGNSDSIGAPATAKNVISVGAIELPRNITNLVRPSYSSTNQGPIWLAGSDSANEVASYSSRGNVGVGEEGEFGRFKPDVVAPGSWVVSTRSKQWNQIAYYNPTNVYRFTYDNQTLPTNGQLNYGVFVPRNAVSLQIAVQPTNNLDLYVNRADTPTNATPDAVDVYTLGFPPGVTDADYYVKVVNPNALPAAYNLEFTITTTNDNGDTFQVLSNKLNEPLGPLYRYESGSSMAAAAVSGTLALMQEFFQSRLGLTNSPALMKALLINGARSLSSQYDFQVQNERNYQGWGLVNLTNSIPATLTANPAGAAAPIQYFDQNPTTALATGQSHTRTISLSAAARLQPLRVTLVWTDPPGDPSASLKLVNDLDLIVTNLDNGQVFFGNDILASTEVNLPWNTNNPANVDFVNNVENIYLTPLDDPLLGANYSVTVVGRRVNVNAVTAHPNDVAQDYALVISSANGNIAGAVTVTSGAATVPTPTVTQPLVTVLASAAGGTPAARTAGGIVFNQRVGANTPLLGTNTITASEVTNGVITVGLTNQWHFYVFSNTNAFTNVAFATFLPPTLSVPRIGTRERDVANATRVQADIDIYVSTNPGLTNLDAAVLTAANKSLGRSGTELITFTNGGNQTYYVGVKAEDQMAAEYAFLGLASELPFSERDADGNLIVRFTTGLIPDGTPDNPGGTNFIGIALEPITIRRVVATNELSHNLISDLFGQLKHDGKSAVLHDHTGNDALVNHAYVYDDSGEGVGNPFGYEVKHTDGPGSLSEFVGEEGFGLWELTMVDDACCHNGQLNNFTLKLEPKPETNSVTVTIQPGGFYRTYVDVPAEGTNLAILVSGNTQPVDLYMRYDEVPTFTEFDVYAPITPPGGRVTLTRGSTPALLTGRYFIAVYNPIGNTAQTVTLTIDVGLDLRGVLPANFASSGIVPLVDDAVSRASISVADTNQIYSVEVGVRIDHERVSDLALTLISPAGTRVLLAENRGMSDTNGYGSTVITTNLVYVSANGGPASNSVAIDVGITSGTVPITYNFYTAPDQLTVYYGTNIVPANLILDTGFTNNPPAPGPVSATNTIPQTLTFTFPPAGAVGGPSSYLTILMNEFGNTNPVTQWTYTIGSVATNYNYFVFTEDLAKTTTPMKYRLPPFRGTAVSVSTNTAFALPESSLEILKGESAQGEWQLEIWDNRVGAATLSPLLLSWDLAFIYVDTTSSSGVTITGTNPPVFNTNITSATFTINEQTLLTVTNSATSANVGAVLTYTLISPPAGAAIDSATGGITWTPTEAQGPGNYTFTTLATDNAAPIANTAANSFTVDVIEVNTAPTLGAVGGQTIEALLPLTVPNSASDGDLPANPISYALTAINQATGDPVTNNPPTISASGVIEWTPDSAQGPGDYQLTTIATDFNAAALANQALSATNSFAVHVDAAAPAPVFAGTNAVVVAGGQVTLRWSAASNRAFAVQWATNLVAHTLWREFTNRVTSPTTNYVFLDDGSQSGDPTATRFYQLRARP